MNHDWLRHSSPVGNALARLQRAGLRKNYQGFNDAMVNLARNKRLQRNAARLENAGLSGIENILKKLV